MTSKGISEISTCFLTRRNCGDPLYPWRRATVQLTVARILIADDDDLFAGMLQKALVNFGHQVTRTRDGKEALQLYAPQSFDLVLTDLMMPNMGGVELIAALRQAHPAVKIIAMSGGGRNNPEASLLLANQAGAFKTLTKPFPLVELSTALRECLESA